MFTEALFTKWITKEKRASASSKKKYLHFDPRISVDKNIPFFRNLFKNEDKLKTHSFYPFIKFTQSTPRYKKSEDGHIARRMEYKERPLLYAAHLDALIYSWFSTILTEEYEKKLVKYNISDNVLAYIEKEESNIEFANTAFEKIKNNSECVVLTFDVNGFFDNLDHEWLKKMWCAILDTSSLPETHYKIYKNLTTFSFVKWENIYRAFPDLAKRRENGVFIERICSPQDFRNVVREQEAIENNSFRNNIPGSKRFNKLCGIPQGSPLSACLSNIYMLGFDIEINTYITNLGGNYYRYSDDIIVIAPVKYMAEVSNKITSELSKYELCVNEKKTEIVFFKRHQNGVLKSCAEDNILSPIKILQYLGFEFNGENIYIRSSSFSRYHRRMSARIRENFKAAYGKRKIGNKVFKRSLLNRYTHKGKRNFITYAERAATIMESKTIRKQYKNSMKKVLKKIDKKQQAIYDKIIKRNRP